MKNKYKFNLALISFLYKLFGKYEHKIVHNLSQSICDSNTSSIKTSECNIVIHSYCLLRLNKCISTHEFACLHQLLNTCVLFPTKPSTCNNVWTLDAFWYVQFAVLLITIDQYDRIRQRNQSTSGTRLFHWVRRKHIYWCIFTESCCIYSSTYIVGQCFVNEYWPETTD